MNPRLYLCHIRQPGSSRDPTTSIHRIRRKDRGKDVRDEHTELLTSKGIKRSICGLISDWDCKSNADHDVGIDTTLGPVRFCKFIAEEPCKYVIIQRY